MELWIKLLFAIFSFGCVVFAQIPDVCPPIDDKTPHIDLPKVPESYHALVQIQSTELKATVNLEYAKLANGYKSLEHDNVKSVAIYDLHRKQLILLAEPSHKLGREGCKVEALNDKNGWDVGNKMHSKTSMRGSDWYLRYAANNQTEILKAVNLGTDVENGVPVQMYGVCLRWKEIKADIYMRVNMTTNENWKPFHPVKSVPTSVWTKVSKDGNVTEDFVTFFDFEVDYQPEGIFNIPDNVVCHELNNLSRAIPNIPKRFSYQSEIITKNRNNITHLIVYQNHIFDSEMNLTRFDYRSVIPAETVDTKHSHAAGVVTQIHDFWSGISFTIDKTTGKCVTTPIPLIQDDVKVVIGNKVIINDPKAFLGLDKLTYTFYKEEVRRGIDAVQFRAYDEKTFLIHEFWFTSAKEIIQEAHFYNHMQPMTHIQYFLTDPMMNRTVTNFFNFDIDRPHFDLYDLSVCFIATGKRRFVFQVGGTLDIMNITNYDDFYELVQLAIVKSTMITPLRVSHIETVSAGKRSYIMFSIFEKMNVTGDGALKDNELTTEQAIGMFRMQLDEDKINIQLPRGAASPTTEGIPYTLKEISDIYNPRDKTGFSDGSMAALGICMILLGLLMGGGAAYLYLLRQK